VGVEVRAGTVEERIAAAREFASDARRAWLIGRVKDSFPLVSDRDAEGLYITWKATAFTSLRGRGQSVRVLVIVGSRAPMANVEDVLSYCASQISAALEGSGHDAGRIGAESST
jgi:hypothetical protein